MKALMMMRRVLPAIAALLTLSIVMRGGTAATYLSIEEMNALRGGSPQVKDCVHSCNAANNFINLCLGGIGPCTVCSKGSDDTHYLDSGGSNCSDDFGYATDPNNTTDCGVKQDGRCLGVSNCGNLQNTATSCTDPQNVKKQ